LAGTSISDYKIYSYRLPLTRPLIIRGIEQRQREGAILVIQSASGAFGFGDIAPLPGVSHESLSQSIRAVRSVVEHLKGESLDADLVFGKRYDPDRALPPTARFAVESAFLAWMAMEAGMSLRHVLGDEVRDIVPVNGLLDGDSELCLQEAKAAMDAGFRSLKIKVARRDLRAEANMVRSISSTLPHGVSMRLDANRGWEREQVDEFVQLIADVKIEYIEEPLRNLDELPDFIESGIIPVALDETLVERGARAFDEHPGIVAAVIKPSIQGGLVDALDLSRQAVGVGIRPVISSLFESGIGIRALAELAASIGIADTSHGLDTLKWFVQDVADPPILLAGGTIDLADDAKKILILHHNVIRDMRDE